MIKIIKYQSENKIQWEGRRQVRGNVSLDNKKWLRISGTEETSPTDSAVSKKGAHLEDLWFAVSHFQSLLFVKENRGSGKQQRPVSYALNHWKSTCLSIFPGMNIPICGSPLGLITCNSLHTNSCYSFGFFEKTTSIHTQIMGVTSVSTFKLITFFQIEKLHKSTVKQVPKEKPLIHFSPGMGTMKISKGKQACPTGIKMFQKSNLKIKYPCTFIYI